MRPRAAQRRRNGSDAPRFASAAGMTLVTQLSVATLSFVSVVVLARSLGPSGRGEVAQLTAMAVISSSLSAFGIEEATINLAGSDPDARPRLATNAVALALLFGGACSGVLALLVAVVPAVGGDTDPALRLVVLAAVPMLLLKLYLKFLVNGAYGFAVTNVAWVLPPLLTAAANVTLAATDRISAATAFGAWVAAHACATAVLVWWIARRSTGFGRPDLGLARRSLRFGALSHPGRVMMTGNYRLDQWIVGSVAGSAELGVYTVAVAWSEVLLYLPTVLMVVQRPYLVRSTADEAGQRTARVLRASVLITAAASAVVVVLAPALCTLVFGERFRGSVTDLRILAVGALGALVLQLLGSAMTAQRRPGRTSIGAGVAFGVTLTFGAVLIPVLGGTGAALTSTVAYLAGGAATAVLFVRMFGCSPKLLVPTSRDVAAVAGLAWRGVRLVGGVPRSGEADVPHGGIPAVPRSRYTTNGWRRGHTEQTSGGSRGVPSAPRSTRRRWSGSSARSSGSIGPDRPRPR